MKKRVQSNKKRIRWASVLTVFVLLIGIIAIAFAAVHLLSPKVNTSQKSSQTSKPKALSHLVLLNLKKQNGSLELTKINCLF